jgi:hypothetical protein
MIAYCILKDGSIHFGDRKPRGTIAIASHDNGAHLRRAVEALAQTQITHQGETAVSTGLCVPWFSTIKYADEKQPFIEQFSHRVQERMRTH